MNFKTALMSILCLSFLLNPLSGAAHAQALSHLPSGTKSIIALAGPVSSGNSELVYFADRLEEQPISADELSDVALNLFIRAFVETSQLNGTPLAGPQGVAALVEAINAQLQLRNSDVRVAVKAESLTYNYSQESDVQLNYRMHLGIYLSGRQTGDLVIEFAVEPEVDVD